METIANIYIFGGLILSPLTTWYYTKLWRKFYSVSIGELLMLFVAACLPLVNIVIVFVLDGVNLSWMNKVVIEKDARK